MTSLLDILQGYTANKGSTGSNVTSVSPAPSMPTITTSPTTIPATLQDYLGTRTKRRDILGSMLPANITSPATAPVAAAPVPAAAPASTGTGYGSWTNFNPEMPTYGWGQGTVADWYASMPPEAQQSFVEYWQDVFPGQEQQWAQYWNQPVSTLMAASGQAGLTPGGWWDWFNTAKSRVGTGYGTTGAGTTGATGAAGGSDIAGSPLANIDFSSFQNLFPTTTSASASGLPPWADKLYQEQLTGFMPAALSGLQNVLGQLQDPQSFIKAYQPIMDQLYGQKMDEMSKRGILPSSLTSDAMRDMNKELSAVYLQNLSSIAQQMTGAGSLAATMGGQTTQQAAAGYSQNPLAPWELLFNILGPFEYG